MKIQKFAFLILSIMFLAISCRKKTVPQAPKVVTKPPVILPETKPEQKPPLPVMEQPKVVEQEKPNQVEKVEKEVSIISAPFFDSRKREFRAAWIATVANIDWPNEKGQTSDQQKADFIKILDHHKAMGINAVFVQIRAASDAFYARSREPWSEWLTGQQGTPPYPYYDPMVFMIEECHKRGIEFHAWFNLNRGMHKKATSVTSNHITRQKPEWFLKYDGYELYNFGIPAVREYLEEVVINVVKNYDIDGVHFDDYFYPYQVSGQVLPDQNTYKLHGYGFNNVGDWRRHNIDVLIKSLSEKITSEKKWVKFGISPFCVWRNQSDDPLGSKTQGGQPSYDNLYADTKKWAEYGWIDYIAPQIYFSFEFDKVPYGTMTDWWIKNKGKALLYIGHSIYKVDRNSNSIGWNDPDEIARQIAYNRENKEIAGSIFYNTNTLMKNEMGVRDSIKNAYKAPVLQPAMTWKDNIPPNAPRDVLVRKTGEFGFTISWNTPLTARDNENVSAYVVYRFTGQQYINLENSAAIVDVLPNDGTNAFLDKTADVNINYVYVVTALDRLHNESPSSNPAQWKK